MRVRTALFAPALAVLLLCGPPAAAQDAGQIGLAREMLVAMKAADNFDAVIPTVMTALKPAVTGGNPKAAKDWDDLVPLMIQEMSSMKSGFLDEVAAIYARAFTGPELRQFVDFYKSPAGAKLATLTPALSQQMMVAGQRFGQQVAARLVERMKDELRKRGNKI